MIKNVAICFILTLSGFVLGVYYTHPLSKKFMEVRLFEIIQLVTTLLFGSFIAYFFSRRLNSWGKRSEIIYNHLSEMLIKYQKGFDKIENFIRDPKSIQTKEITLIFKMLSSNIATLEKHEKKLKLDIDKVKAIRTSHDRMNELIVKDTWGIDPAKMEYSDVDKSNVKKEYTNIITYIDELRFELYK